MTKRITVFAGHYGSGKTNVALNYALDLRKKGLSVQVEDLDIVNPYFRTKDAENVLKQNGIRLISSEYANSNVDTPALPGEAYSAFQDRHTHAVIDVGGDDRGALARGRYAELMKQENDYDFFAVINKYRFLTRTPEDTVKVLQEIESACKVRFTGVINNSNLGEETTAEAVLDSVPYAEAVSKVLGVPIAYTSVKYDLVDKINLINVLPIKLYVRQSWLRKEEENGKGKL